MLNISYFSVTRSIRGLFRCSGVCAAILLIGCQQQGNERLREKTSIEADEQFQKVDARARAVESTLQAQRRFYSALEGAYQGIMMESLELENPANGNTGPDREFKVDARIFRKFPPPPPLQRAPTIEELTNELNSMALDVLIRPSSITNRNGAAGCIAEGVKPNLNLGLISILRETCPNGVTLQIGEFESIDLIQSSLKSNRLEDWKALIPKVRASGSDLISQKLMSGELSQIQVLQGRLVLLSRQVEYRLFLFRVPEVFP